MAAITVSRDDGSQTTVPFSTVQSLTVSAFKSQLVQNVELTDTYRLVRVRDHTPLVNSELVGDLLRSDDTVILFSPSAVSTMIHSTHVEMDEIMRATEHQSRCNEDHLESVMPTRSLRDVLRTMNSLYPSLLVYSYHTLREHSDVKALLAGQVLSPDAPDEEIVTTLFAAFVSHENRMLRNVGESNAPVPGAGDQNPERRIFHRSDILNVGGKMQRRLLESVGVLAGLQQAKTFFILLKLLQLPQHAHKMISTNMFLQHLAEMCGNNYDEESPRSSPTRPSLYHLDLD